MDNSFKTRHPDFASIEVYIRRAHAERSVAIATAFADAIIAVIRGIGRLTSAKPAQRTAAGTLVVKTQVERTVRA